MICDIVISELFKRNSDREVIYKVQTSLKMLAIGCVPWFGSVVAIRRC